MIFSMRLLHCELSVHWCSEVVGVRIVYQKVYPGCWILPRLNTTPFCNKVHWPVKWQVYIPGKIPYCVYCVAMC